MSTIDEIIDRLDDDGGAPELLDELRHTIAAIVDERDYFRRKAAERLGC